MKFKKILMGAMFSLLCIPALSSCGLFDDGVDHIKSKEDLLNLNFNSKYVLDNDIDCEGLYMPSLYQFDKHYGYTFDLDGQGHTIKNLSVLAPVDSNTAGFIAFCDEGQFSFSNINFENYNLVYDNYSEGTVYAGALVGLTNGNISSELLPPIEVGSFLVHPSLLKIL